MRRFVLQQDAFDIFPCTTAKYPLRLAGDASNMGCKDQSFCRFTAKHEQWIVCLRRFGRIDVDSGAAELSGTEACGKRGFVNNTAARSIDKHCPRFHLRQLLRANKVFGRGQERYV